MRGLEAQIYMKVVVEKDLSMSEIQALFPEVSDRTVIRKVNTMVKNRLIERKRIHGKGKRERYFVKEETIKQDLRARAFDIKGKKYVEVKATMTQRNLSSNITEWIKLYNKELKKFKNQPESEYYYYHIAMISDCLSWVTKLTFAINSGILGNSPNKLALAYRNKERYEEFLQKLIYNIKKKDEKLADEIIKAIENQIIDTWLLEKLLT